MRCDRAGASPLRYTLQIQETTDADTDREKSGRQCSPTALAACDDPAARRERAAAAARAKVDAGSERAQTVAGTGGTGAWDDAQLLKRLVDAGLAPQKRDSVKSLPWMGVPVLAYQLGNATIDAYVYRDSTARKDAVAKLDPMTFAPRGGAGPRNSWVRPTMTRSSATELRTQKCPMA